MKNEKGYLPKIWDCFKRRFS